MPTDYNPTQYTDAEVEASIHAVLDAFANDSPFGAAAGYTEAEHVLDLLEQGEIEGSVFYDRRQKCGCLLGSIVSHRLDPEQRDTPFAVISATVPYSTLASHEAQILFGFISPGDTPTTHAPARFAKDCIQRWLNARQRDSLPQATVIAQRFTAREIEAIFKEVTP